MNLHPSVALALAVMCGIAPLARAAVDPVPVNARVVWVRDDRVYIASPDSQVLAFGARLTLLERKQPIATAEIERVIDSTLSVARLTSGSLARVRDLGRLRVLAAPAHGPRTLRVGYPTRKRGTLFFTCDHLMLIPPFGPGLYVMQASDHLYRVMPIPWMRERTTWPDTLTIRLFDDAGDEEIALERGDIEVAVFWPGELSTHTREQPRWVHDLTAPMSRGLVAAVRPESQGEGVAAAMVGPDDPTVSAMARELFRGDLDARRFASAAATPPTAASGWHFESDPAIPGRSVLDRFLARSQGATAPAGAPVVRLVYLDTTLSPPDSIAIAVADLARGGPVPSVDPLFAIDCPVVCDERLRPYVSALGPRAFVELFDCVVVGGRR